MRVRAAPSRVLVFARVLLCSLQGCMHRANISARVRKCALLALLREFSRCASASSQFSFPKAPARATTR